VLVGAVHWESPLLNYLIDVIVNEERVGVLALLREVWELGRDVVIKVKRGRHWILQRLPNKLWINFFIHGYYLLVNDLLDLPVYEVVPKLSKGLAAPIPIWVVSIITKLPILTCGFYNGAGMLIPIEVTLLMGVHQDPIVLRDIILGAVPLLLELWADVELRDTDHRNKCQASQHRVSAFLQPLAVFKNQKALIIVFLLTSRFIHHVSAFFILPVLLSCLSKLFLFSKTFLIINTYFTYHWIPHFKLLCAFLAINLICSVLTEPPEGFLQCEDLIGEEVFLYLVFFSAQLGIHFVPFSPFLFLGLVIAFIHLFDLFIQINHNRMALDGSFDLFVKVFLGVVGALLGGFLVPLLEQVFGLYWFLGSI